MQKSVREPQKDDPRSLTDQGSGIPKGYVITKGGNENEYHHKGTEP